MRGNTVVVVEHDETFMKTADYVIDIGTRAGIHGGELIYQGDYPSFIKCTKSLTACYLADQIMRKKQKYRCIENNNKRALLNINKHNMKNMNVDIPLSVLVGIAGRSGSGKSSLIVDTLMPLLKNRLKNKMVVLRMTK